MATQSDDTNLAALTIPGTHESMAQYEPLAGTAKCQDLTLDAQYDAGIRYVDIRCRDLDDMFAMYHGPVDEQETFDQVLDTTFTFLDTHPSETIVMSIKEESTEDGATRSFEETFASYVAKRPDRWYTGASIPALGDVRGKIVLLRRFSATMTPLGIDGSAWADNTTFTLTNPDSTLRVEDAYTVSDPATKWTAITSLFGEAQTGDLSTLFLTYTSGYESDGLIPNITSVSDAINPMLDAYFADPANAGAHLGTLAMDWVSEDRVRAVAALNPITAGSGSN
jgi:1-phosphatidylinositol phosphodiesterase